MIFQTPIMALLLVSALASLVALWSAGFALQVLRHWDVASGSRDQLRLERTTQLVSTLFAAVLLAEIAALLLFVFNADRMSALFVGAMCAVGTLGVDPYGFPALYLKIGVFFAAALWLLLDRADRLGRDYPLTRVKYAALLVVAPLILANAGTELAYFLGLETDVITSCCSKLFTPANDSLAGEMTGIAPGLSLWLLGLSGLLVALTGAVSLWRNRGHWAFALSGVVFFLIAILAIISVIALYVYDHPNHHCPFCILQPEYGYYGYVLYLPLFTGTALALGVGVIQPFARVPSLAHALPSMVRKLTLAALVAYGLFGVAVLAAIATSRLILFG